MSGRLLGYDRGYRKMFPSDRAGFAGGASLIQPELTGKDLLMPFGKADSPALALKERHYGTKAFVPAGQSTQMIVGATPENDFQMLSVTQALYHNFGLKRVFILPMFRLMKTAICRLFRGPPFEGAQALSG